MLFMHSTLFPGTLSPLLPVSESQVYTQCGPASRASFSQTLQPSYLARIKLMSFFLNPKGQILEGLLKGPLIWLEVTRNTHSSLTLCEVGGGKSTFQRNPPLPPYFPPQLLYTFKVNGEFMKAKNICVSLAEPE